METEGTTKMNMEDQEKTEYEDIAKSDLEPTVSEGSDSNRLTKRQLFKSNLILALVYMLVFTAYMGLASLQSSLHMDEGLGVISQAVIYGCFALSCMFLPKVVISKIGHKWTITVSIVSYILWMAANAYPVWATMIPTSILVGLSAGPLWASQSSYITLFGTEYARLKDVAAPAVLANFFGTWTMVYNLIAATIVIIPSIIMHDTKEGITLDGIWGSMISAFILTPRGGNYSTPSEEELEYCGLNDCPWNNVTSPHYDGPPDYVVWILVGAYIAVALVGFVISIIFVTPVPEYMLADTKRKYTGKEVWDLFTTTMKHIRHIGIQLLIPLSLYTGLQYTFVDAEFSKSWVTCYLGIWWIGWINIAASTISVPMVYFFGKLVKYTGRILVMSGGLLLEFGILLALLLWNPHPDDVYAFFLLRIFLVIARAMWLTQSSPVLGDLYPKTSELAFSNRILFETLAQTAAYSYSAYLCTDVKLYIMLSVFLAGAIGYGGLEVREYRKKSNTTEDPLEMFVEESTKM